MRYPIHEIAKGLVDQSREHPTSAPEQVYRLRQALKDAYNAGLERAIEAARSAPGRVPPDGWIDPVGVVAELRAAKVERHR